jgi:predicted phosphodiesterase
MKNVKYGIFSDIHSNLEALVAVLQDMREHGVTHTVCLGDIVGYNANPRECVQVVRTLGCPVIKGNHDDIVATNQDARHFNALAGEGITHSKKALREEEKSFLRGLPMQARIADFTVVHASLDDPEDWNYVNTGLEAESSFTYQHTQLCFCGHTHIAKIFIREREVREVPKTAKLELKKNCRYLVNVGAVGQPRDRDWRASYVIYHPESRTVEFRRVAYDLEASQSKIMSLGLPEPLAARLAMGV